MTDAPTPDVDDDPDDELDDELDDDDPNRIPAATARAVLDHLVRSIVDDPDSVEVEVEERRRGVALLVHVAPDDMGRVIGKRGRTASAIRTVVRAAATRDGVEADVDFVD